MLNPKTNKPYTTQQLRRLAQNGAPWYSLFVGDFLTLLANGPVSISGRALADKLGYDFDQTVACLQVMEAQNIIGVLSRRGFAHIYYVTGTSGDAVELVRLKADEERRKQHRQMERTQEKPTTPFVLPHLGIAKVLQA